MDPLEQPRADRRPSRAEKRQLKLAVKQRRKTEAKAAKLKKQVKKAEAKAAKAAKKQQQRKSKATDTQCVAADRLSGQGDGDAAAGHHLSLRAGDCVECRLPSGADGREATGPWYRGKIDSVRAADGTFDVSFDDGDAAVAVSAERIRRATPSRREVPSSSSPAVRSSRRKVTPARGTRSHHQPPNAPSLVSTLEAVTEVPPMLPREAFSVALRQSKIPLGLTLGLDRGSCSLVVLHLPEEGGAVARDSAAGTVRPGDVLVAVGEHRFVSTPALNDAYDDTRVFPRPLQRADVVAMLRPTNIRTTWLGTAETEGAAIAATDAEVADALLDDCWPQTESSGRRRTSNVAREHDEAGRVAFLSHLSVAMQSFVTTCRRPTLLGFERPVGRNRARYLHTVVVPNASCLDLRIDKSTCMLCARVDDQDGGATRRGDRLVALNGEAFSKMSAFDSDGEFCDTATPRSHGSYTIDRGELITAIATLPIRETWVSRFLHAREAGDMTLREIADAIIASCDDVDSSGRLRDSSVANFLELMRDAMLGKVSRSTRPLHVVYERRFTRRGAQDEGGMLTQAATTAPPVMAQPRSADVSAEQLAARIAEISASRTHDRETQLLEARRATNVLAASIAETERRFASVRQKLSQIEEVASGLERKASRGGGYAWA